MNVAHDRATAVAAVFIAAQVHRLLPELTRTIAALPPFAQTVAARLDIAQIYAM